MHRIESIEISGFKSFRNKVNVRFDGAISSVVGPNGCGKSNVCDAFMWVLGEQSARVLRGAKMDDVIFNGTQRYGPVSFAEVTLRLKYLPEDGVEDMLTREDIEISRRLYRDGAGEYFLNGKRCRLMDIQKTFEGTGLGFTSYAIIEQGRIQDLINSKPMEKRALLEDAARVISYKHSKKEVKLKLEMAQQNLLRLRDVIAEIERSQKALKVQVQRAKRYSHLNERMRLFQKVRICLLSEQWGKALDDIAEKAVDVDARLSSAAGAVWSATAGLNVERGRLAEEEAALRTFQDKASDIRMEIQRVHLSSDHVVEQRASLEDRLAQIGREQAEAGGRVAGREGDKDRLEQAISAFERARKEADSELAGREAQFRQSQKALADKERHLEQLRQRAFDDAGKATEWKNREARLVERDGWVRRQDQKLESDMASAREHSSRLIREISDQEDTIQMMSGKMEGLDVEKGRLREELSVWKGRSSDLQRKLAETERALADCRHRTKSIDEMLARHEPLSDSLRKFLPTIQDEPGYRGTLADFLECGEKFEGSIEDFLRDELESMVVDHPGLVRKGMDFLRGQKGGRFRFLLSEGEAVPQSVARGDLSGIPGVVGRLEGQLSGEEEGRRMLRRAVDGVGDVWVVEDLGSALALAPAHPGVVCLSRDGAAVTSAGRVTLLGATGAKGLLGYRREKRDLQESLAKHRAEVEEIQDSREMAERGCKDVQGRLEGVEEAVREYRSQIQRNQDEVRRKGEDLSRANKMLKTLEAELGVARAECGRISSELAEVRALILAQRDRTRESQGDFEVCMGEIAVLKGETAELNAVFNQARTVFLTAKERAAAAQSELRQVLQSLEENRGRTMALATEREKVAEKLARLSADGESLRGSLLTLEGERDATDGRIEGARKRVAERRKSLSEHEARVEVSRSEHDSLKDRKTLLDLEKARAQGEVAHLEEDSATLFHVRLSALHMPDDPAAAGIDAEAAQQTFLEYREQVEKMGNVNLVALDEYDQGEERLQFQLAQENDVIRSIESTQKAIEEIDRLCVEKFRETFKQVNRNFQELFSLLFGGGFCELRLVEEDNVIDSGVDIVASPPGKKLQNILLLSGGEKALAALALMLAVFRYRPSPFCILDEVDAPLDDSNIDRFVSLIKEMSSQTQYILITHNKRTMEISDTICGITMEEAGISKVVAVQMKDFDKLL